MESSEADQPSPTGSDRISYSVEQAAKSTGVGRSYIYLAIKHGELASLKLGRRRLILHEDLVAWLKSRRTEQQAA